MSAFRWQHLRAVPLRTHRRTDRRHRLCQVSGFRASARACVGAACWRCARPEACVDGSFFAEARPLRLRSRWQLQVGFRHMSLPSGTCRQGILSLAFRTGTVLDSYACQGHAFRLSALADARMRRVVWTRSSPESATSHGPGSRKTRQWSLEFEALPDHRND